LSSATLKDYYQLTKPGVLYGNVITGVAGFLLAAGYFRVFNAWLFLATIVGMTLIIASACVLNNFLDQDIDRLMERTQKRAMAAGTIPGKHAVILAIVLGVLGILILIVGVNWLTVAVGVGGYITYVWLYGALSKRLSWHGTLVGSISGAAPILAGYCAVSGRIDAAAILVFLMLFFWQFPEFYSIAIYRRKEYKKAGVPVITVVKGVPVTIRYIFFYTIAFVISSLLLTPLGYTGWIYFTVMAVTGVYWVQIGWQGFKTDNKDAWARKMFHFSLIALMVLSGMLSVGALLP
jgi:protoheme IX farnesyltransferase